MQSGFHTRPMEIKCEAPFIDSHVHIDEIMDRLKISPSDLNVKLLGRLPSGSAVIAVFCDPSALSSFSVWEDIAEHPQLFATFGCHPHSASQFPKMKEKLLQRLVHPKVVAVGETGLDFYRDLSPRDEQVKAFISQLEIAKELNKPVVVHCREAHDEVFEILRERLHKEFPIHMHCFTGTDEQAKRLLNQFDNLYLGFTGLIVSRNMDEVIRAVPLN